MPCKICRTEETDNPDGICDEFMSPRKKLKSSEVNNMEECKHKWGYSDYIKYWDNQLPLPRKCTKCDQIDKRMYLGGEMWQWVNFKSGTIRGKK